MSEITYEVRKPGSVSFIIDNGHWFVLQKSETKVEFGTELEFNTIDAIVPFGAELDKSFIKNIENAKSIREVQDICTSWVNV